MTSYQWKYRHTNGIIAFIAVLILAGLASLLFLPLFFDGEARAFFLGKLSRGDFSGLLLLLFVTAVFALMGWVLCRGNLKNWFRSFTDRDYTAIDRYGLTHKYQGAEIWTAWEDIKEVQELKFYRYRQLTHDYDALIVLHEGGHIPLPISQLSRPLESLALASLIFIVPFAGAFGFKTVAVGILLAYPAARWYYTRKNRQIIRIISETAYAYRRRNTAEAYRRRRSL